MATTQELKTKFTSLLQQMFQLDQPELDFGIYRIMHARKDDINRFIEQDLPKKITEAFAGFEGMDKQQVAKELEKAQQAAIAAGFDPSQSPKVKELEQQYNAKVDLTREEGEVYDALITFFNRYYDEGDFISRRIYKDGTYAIPYNGEEVVLHWANKGQYYIKSSENLRDYTFRLNPHDEQNPMRVHFKLVDAEAGASNNNKEAEGKNRVFVLRQSEEQPSWSEVSVKNGITETTELEIYFEFRAATENDWTETVKASATAAAKKKPPTQDHLRQIAVELLIGEDSNLPEKWRDPLSNSYVKANGETADYSLLQGQINNYTKANKFDYFIHKDLGKFLRQELDFYIKNELMRWEDIAANKANFAKLGPMFSKIEVIRQLGEAIITFLAQLEDFQKKLWLKKKFVTETQYCITLDRLQESPGLVEIALNNDAQRQEWIDLFNVDLAELDQLKANGVERVLEHTNYRFLLVDTKFFDAGFKNELLASIDDIDEQINGLLVNSENFQALNLIQDKFKEKVKCIYIDPPYNSGGNDFLYKDAYQNSSWLSMLYDRVIEAAKLLPEDGVVFIHIDDKDEENRVSHRLMTMVESIFGKNNYLDNLIWIKNTTHNDAKTFSHNHEYILAFAKNRSAAAEVHEMFRQNKPGYAEVMELVHGLNPEYPTIDEIQEKIRALYKEQTTAYKESVLAEGRAWNDEAKKSDPWKGIKQYNNAEYRDSRGNLVDESEAKDKGAKIWVYMRDNSSWPNAGSLTTAHKTEGDPDYRFYQPLHPITGKPCPAPKTGWRWRQTPNLEKPDTLSFEKLVEQNFIAFGEDELTTPRNKKFLHTVDTDVVKSTMPDYTDGEKELANVLGERGVFSNPKPTSIGRKLIEISTGYTDTVLDFFAGSGTSIQAVIQQNIVDEKARQFIGVEMGNHFDEILQKRVKKSLYSVHWKDGVAEQLNHISAFYKYIRLESYEDTLGNLALNRPDQIQSDMFNSQDPDMDSAREEYLLNYMLEVETRRHLSR